MMIHSCIKSINATKAQLNLEGIKLMKIDYLNLVLMSGPNSLKILYTFGS